MSTTVIIPNSNNNLVSSITELLLTVTTSSVNIILPQKYSVFTISNTPTIPTVLDNISLIIVLYIGILLLVLTITLVVVSHVFKIVIIRYRKKYNG